MILLEGLEILPAVDDGSRIDAFAYPSFELCQRLDSDMAQKASCHLAEQSLDYVEPGAMLWRQHVLETVGVPGKECLRLFGDVRE